MRIRSSASQHVRLDAITAPVVHRPNVHRVLQVAVYAPDLVQVLVTPHHVLGAEVLAAGTDQILAVQPRFQRDLRLVEL